MRGHVRERGKGNWYAVLSVTENGKRKVVWHSLPDAKGKREAQQECARLITAMQSGGYVEPNRITLAQYMDRWLEHIRTQVSPRTHERYCELARLHLIPALGAAKLSKLEPVHISTAYAQMLASGRRDGTGGLAPKTIGHIHNVLRSAIKQACVWRLIARNVASLVKPPKRAPKKMQVLDADQTADLVELARGTGMFVPVLLSALCGLRRGEITAMRWRAIDLEKGHLSVVASTEQTGQGVREKEPKSGRSRTVALPAMVVSELRRHRTQQAESLLRVGVRLTDDQHVVARADGEPLQPHSLSEAFRNFACEHDVPIRLHGLRHTHATQLLKAGVHPKIAQERLGHSNIAMTLDLYSHVLPGMQEDAAGRVDAAIQTAIKNRNRK